MVIHPSTNLYLCCLTSNSLHSIILLMSYWYSIENESYTHRTSNQTSRPVIFVQRLRSKPWTYKSKFILSFRNQFRKSVTSPCPRTFENILEQRLPVCLVTSPGLTEHSSTVQLYTHHSSVMYTAVAADHVYYETDQEPRQTHGDHP